MQHAVALGMHEGKALGAHQLLSLLTKNGGTDICTLIAHRHHIDLRCSVVPPITIEVTLPKALDAKVIQTIIASEGCWIITTLFTSLLRFNNVPIRHIDEHRLVLKAISTTVHVLEALETKVIFAVCAKDLWTFHRTCRAKTTASCRECCVVLARALTAFV
jgi:hypothetical protein